MSYRISGLAPELFRPLFGYDDAKLAMLDIRRVVAADSHGYPCRVSLEDAAEGEALLLLPYVHHAPHGPYRASGPVYVREKATARAIFEDSVPPFLVRRLLSIRAYDADGWMRAAEVSDGSALDSTIRTLFNRQETKYLHVHNARPGCYSCLVERI